MTERFLKPLSFLETIKEVLKTYALIFKPIIGIVLVAALIQAVVSIVMPENPTVGLAISLLGSVVAMFFYGWILYYADSILMNRNEGSKEALEVAKKRFLYLLGVLLIWIVLVAIFFLFGFGMQYLGNLLHALIIFGIITFAIILFVFTLLAFAMPAVVLDQMPVLKSFEYSVRLVWGHWWRVFGVMVIFIVPVVLLSFAGLLLPTRNIFIITIYEYIYHIITYPLMIALILVLYHDLKTRHQKEGFKHVTEVEREVHH